MTIGPSGSFFLNGLSPWMPGISPSKPQNVQPLSPLKVIFSSYSFISELEAIFCCFSSRWEYTKDWYFWAHIVYYINCFLVLRFNDHQLITRLDLGMLKRNKIKAFCSFYNYFSLLSILSPKRTVTLIISHVSHCSHLCQPGHVR